MQKNDFTWRIPYSNDEAIFYEEIQLLNLKIEKILYLINNLQPKQKEFLTIQEVAEICNVKSQSTLWNWKQKGKLVPTMKAGKKPLYKRQDVIDFLKTKTHSNNK